jgi:16S rRNA (guanine(966)-N(2))-methyltransferase RsmD
MRIIAGEYKRRFIHPPANLPVRPTTDLARESLFNILNNIVEWQGKSVLDLFAGTGAVSYEFISRGCDRVLAVDSNFQCVSFIKKTASSFEMDNLKVMRTDVFRFLKSAKINFDIIFADPPYEMEGIDKLPDLIFDNDLLTGNGIFVLEHPRKYDFSEHPHFNEHRKYGKVNFSFFS